ncbi:hypothetical protein P43SY_001416 [Pythium insidiosum]|uniref:Uncharacterized protein n=1 Tax=Pythium insidiosum TaxID=114742 RepID=A0AAD5M4H5_PYTIN|nr:hypothetical protein P43SY_001416 [Pythium insidiosum]
MLHARLQLVGCDRALGLALERLQFTGLVASALSPFDRFQRFRRVAEWLLQQLGVSAADAEPLAERPPLVAAQLLLLAAERADVRRDAVQRSAAMLTTGVGLDVCLLLDALCERVELATAATRGPPLYGVGEEVEDIGASVLGQSSSSSCCSGSASDATTATVSPRSDCVDDDEHRDGEDDDSDGEEDDAFARWLIVRELDAGNADDPTAMIETDVDPAAWRREAERVSTALVQRCRSSRQRAETVASGWRSRLDRLERLHAAVDASGCCEETRRVRARVQVEREQLERLESRVGASAAVVGSQRTAQELHARLRSLEASLQPQRRRVDDALVRLADTERRVQTASERLQTESTRLADASPLARLRSGVCGLSDDNERLRVSIETLRLRLWRQQQREQQQQSARGRGS